MHWDFILESYLVTVFVPELQKNNAKEIIKVKWKLYKTQMYLFQSFC